MQLSINLQEATKSIKANLLRTILTASIIAIGITSLVGILTAIDAVQYSITSGLSNLGANSFDIKDLSRRNRRRSGVSVVAKNPITYQEVNTFKEKFDLAEKISVSTTAGGAVEIKRFSKKTTPNYSIVGVDEYYLNNQALTLEKGRNFSRMELSLGNNVAIIGKSVKENLFETNEEIINEYISFKGKKYKIVGVLNEGGGLNSGGTDRSVLIPLLNANKFAVDQSLYYTITTSIDNPSQINTAMEEARGIMRIIRADELGKPDSFEISRSESIASTLESTSVYLRLGGGLIGFITLLGASIGLMNIMLVSVTERTREIGIRKALGAKPSVIRWQFLMEAIVICLIGGIAGVMLGLVIGNLVARITGAESFVIPWFWMSFGIIICVAVGLLSGYYPASKASRLDPIESLRYE